MGALKNIMHKGDLSAQASLSDFDTTESLYALGAVENLKGEVQIFDGKPYSSYVEGDSLRFDTTLERNATLLVYAHVKEWEEVVIPQPAFEYETFEAFLAEQAVKRGLESPFPFLINGVVQSVNWHTINWPDGDTEHSHEKHIRSGLYGEMQAREVEMLGSGMRLLLPKN
jgi:acetolactate decarboxylase